MREGIRGTYGQFLEGNTVHRVSEGGSNGRQFLKQREKGENRREEGVDRRDPPGSEREGGRRRAGLARSVLGCCLALGPGCGPVGLGHHPFLFFVLFSFLFISNFYFGF
jgi:hypothetical protein